MFIALLTFFLSSGVTGNDPLDQGYSAMYNLDFAGAHKAFQEWEKNKPDDPFGPASDAAAYLFFEFERLKVLRSEFFTEDRSFLTSRKLQPDPKVKDAFEQALKKSQGLSAAMLKRGDTPDRAEFAGVISIALHADYLALIEKDNMRALTEIKAAREKAQSLVAKYPAYKDAYLAEGVENYLLSQKFAPIRLLLRIGGAQTDKQVGLEKLKIVASQGHYLRPYAKLLLAIAALRDNNHSLALQLMSELTAQFPGNDLFRDEVKKLTR